MISSQSGLYLQSMLCRHSGRVLPVLFSAVAILLITTPASYAGNKLPASEPAQKPDTLAMVNGEPITSADFLTRFEMSVYPGKDDPTMLEKTKREFLYSMIAEKILAQAAARSNTPYTTSEDLVRKEMDDVFMRDVLFRREIT